ncbi:MAG: SRPBCC domain-containing protein, partial [Planctomycetes bacterium]|nr:SRPBCC domain-containing protein [Planctomycetota bacterium]
MNDIAPLEITRRFAAPPLTVYEAWTSEQAFAAWSWGDLASDVTATLDVRPGGAYEVATARPDG